MHRADSPRRCDVLAFDVSSFCQAAPASIHAVRVSFRGAAEEHADHWHRRLLRARRERPRGRRSAQK
jgi:hypothetical protein